MQNCCGEKDQDPLTPMTQSGYKLPARPFIFNFCEKSSLPVLTEWLCGHSSNGFNS